MHFSNIITSCFRVDIQLFKKTFIVIDYAAVGKELFQEALRLKTDQLVLVSKTNFAYFLCVSQTTIGNKENRLLLFQNARLENFLLAQPYSTLQNLSFLPFTQQFFRLKHANNHEQTKAMQLCKTVLKYFVHLIKPAPKQRLNLLHFHTFKGSNWLLSLVMQFTHSTFP